MCLQVCIYSLFHDSDHSLFGFFFFFLVQRINVAFAVFVVNSLVIIGNPPTAVTISVWFCFVDLSDLFYLRFLFSVSLKIDRDSKLSTPNNSDTQAEVGSQWEQGSRQGKKVLVCKQTLE